MDQEQRDGASPEMTATDHPVAPSIDPQADEEEKKRTKKERLIRFVHSVSASIYVSRFLSAWGDRMWAFAVGVYLATLSPNSLRLVAIYGFSLAAAGIFMGAIIGDIVDRYPRLTVARTALACQNLLVALCAVLICMIYRNKEYIYSEPWKSGLCEASIIILSVLASLFSMALRISVEKEWLSVICEGNGNKLARLSSITRGIDQFTNTAAPALTGPLMTFGGMFVSAIVVAAWNVCSVFVEYYFLWRIYNKVPALSQRKSSFATGDSKSASEGNAEEVETKPKLELMPPYNNNAYKSSDLDNDATGQVEIISSEDNSKTDKKSDKTLNAAYLEDSTVEPDAQPNAITENGKKSAESSKSDRLKENSSKPNRYLSVLKKMFSVFITLKNGWSVYFGYKVKYAGMGLAAVYMTVCGFDSITIAYAYSQGANEAIVGAMMSLSSVVGIGATLAYPLIRKRLGIERTGLLGFIAEIACLSLCVISVWAPGSPFDLSPHTSENPGNATEDVYQVSNSSESFSPNSTATASSEQTNVNFTSLSFLMAGIIAARFGLWTLDLSVNQLLLERVDCSERGVVNGVQDSLNYIMDILKSILVIAIPAQRHFGILICLSFLFVCLGCVSFASYCYRMRVAVFTSCQKRSEQYGIS